MKSIESGRRIESTKRYVRDHIFSTVLFGVGAVGIGSAAYGASGFMIDSPQSEPSFSTGEEALQDANHINSIKNQDGEEFQRIKSELNNRAEELTSDEEYVSAKKRNDRYGDALSAGFLGILGLLAPVQVVGEKDNIRRRKERKLKEGLTQAI